VYLFRAQASGLGKSGALSALQPTTSMYQVLIKHGDENR
jgi:hypothetical protein